MKQVLAMLSFCSDGFGWLAGLTLLGDLLMPCISYPFIVE
jgi:hypothetical protein